MENSVLYTPERLKYLNLLAEQFPTFQALCTEIVNLGAILNLPKGTEHFMSDLHGEYEAFSHILNNCSGVIREKVHLWLNDRLTETEMDELCTLIYYPAEKLKRLSEEGRTTDDWYRKNLVNLIYLAKMLASKYTRSKVRKAMPQAYAYILDELLHAYSDEGDNHQQYHQMIIDTLIDIRNCDAFVEALSALIKRLAVDCLHVIGDIFDRGPRADSIMDMLMQHHNVDLAWGNHDILWMGAASGCLACVAAVVRNCLSYNNMEILESGYGISLRPLTLFAEKLYPALPPEKAALEAITVMMFKLEGELIIRNPQFEMEERLLLDKISSDTHTIRVEQQEYPLQKRSLPTVDQSRPYALTAEEQLVISDLCGAFLQSSRLRTHVEFLYARGRMYRCCNDNLLFHGCVPLDKNGDFKTKALGKSALRGKALMDYADVMARKAFYEHRPDAVDFMWYLWCGSDSPLCGRHVQTCLRFFADDRERLEESSNAYYELCNDEHVCMRILAEFGMEPQRSRIINGHTPVRVTHGESPIKAGGKLIVIDGGFCKAYQKTTGIAGFTLIANSHGMRMMSHQPFATRADALACNRDILSESFSIAFYPQRRRVRDTDNGCCIRERIDDLKDLLQACRGGQVDMKP